jgi:hypothetical protein
VAAPAVTEAAVAARTLPEAERASRSRAPS